MYTQEIIDILISGLELAQSRGAFTLEEASALFTVISEGSNNETPIVDQTSDPVVSTDPTPVEPETTLESAPITNSTIVTTPAV